MGYVL